MVRAGARDRAILVPEARCSEWRKEMCREARNVEAEVG
jgi:hypothetical protein